ncbi:T9SS type A sorting domain-containing protein [Hymenobacter koreensis]|uniref:Secretion system C-terminal sorting domain-containing protein n=1 Tax=Hymenobacter koreensis TaxID=1084523 RepID=A0ABP8JJ30_9BACT
MKHLYALPVLLALVASAAQAQDYRPFRMGTAYQFTEAVTAADTIHTLRLESATLVGADSVFRFNGRVVGKRFVAPGCYATHVQRPDNLFGATLTKRPGHEWRLSAANGRTFTLRPRAALNQPWPATAAGLTAQVTSRAVAPVLGQPDSVVTIALSDGKTLQISKRYGLLSGPALGAYLNGQRVRQLSLSALPELRLGTALTGPLAVHDFQPNDVFLKHSQHEAFVGLCSEEWERDSVLTRTPNQTGDTITYTIWSRTLRRQYSYTNAPPNSCSGPAGTTLLPPVVRTVVVTRSGSSSVGNVPMLTNSAMSPVNTGTRVVRVSLATSSSAAAYMRRPITPLITRQVACGPFTGDSVRLSEIIDNTFEQRFAAGLGLVSSSTWGLSATFTTTLLGYRKVNLPTGSGTEQWGTLRTFSQILKVADYRPAASTAVFPNPFAQELTVRFESGRAHTAQLRVFNALGQLVHETSCPVSAGTQQLALALPALPAGLYSLHLRHDGRTEIVKIVRAD